MIDVYLRRFPTVSVKSSFSTIVPLPSFVFTRSVATFPGVIGRPLK
jgi:hypothetical protein